MRVKTKNAEEKEKNVSETSDGESCRPEREEQTNKPFGKPKISTGIFLNSEI